MASQREWPRVSREGSAKAEPTGRFLTPDVIMKSDRSLAGPLRHGTAPGVGPRGRAVIADYEQRSDFGTDMIARDRRIDRKFPSDLVAREVRGPGSSNRQVSRGDESKRKPG